VADEKGWKRFQRLGFDSKKFSRRARRAETTTARHAHKFVLSKLDSLRSARQHITLWLLLIVVLIGAVALQMYWYQQAYRATAWKEGGTFAEAVLGPISTLNPLYATTPAEQSASKLLFSSLYRYDDTGNLADDAATSMTVSPDGKKYTVTIRDDVSWSDDVKLTADDVVFTVDLMKSPEVRSVMYNNWVDVSADAIDTRTVVFTLPAPYASFPHALTFSVLPKHVLETVPAGAIRSNAFSVSPVGSGPFTLRLLQIAPDRQHKIANLSASENYYRGTPKLTRFELHAYNEQDDMTRALQTGEVNAAAGIANAEALPDSFVVKQYPINSGVYAIFNAKSQILADSKVRKALQVGTSTTDVRRSLNMPVPELHLPFINGQISGADVPKIPKYNVAQAKKLLDEAGWKIPKGQAIRQKKGVPLLLSVATVKDSDYENALEELAGQWRSLGIEVRTVIKDPSVTQDFVQNTLQRRDFDVLLYELVIGVDPDVYAYWHSSQASQLGYNFANYRNDISDDALASARSRSEPALRNEKYKVFAEQWLKDAPAIGLYQVVMQYAYRPSVMPDIRVGGTPAETDRYADVIYWAAEQVPVYKTP